MASVCDSVVVTATVTKLSYLHVVKQTYRINTAMHKRKSAAQNFTVVITSKQLSINGNKTQNLAKKTEREK